MSNADPSTPAPSTSAPSTSAAGLSVTVRYFAGARAAAGVDQETMSLPVGSSIATLTAVLADHHAALADVLGRCSYLLDAVSVRDPDIVLPDGATVDVLPPFAGG